MKSSIFCTYCRRTVYILTLIVGATTVWSSPAKHKLETDEELFGRVATDDEISWILSSLMLGLMLGPLLFGKLADIIGRKSTILAIGAIHIIAYSLLTFGREVSLFIFARIMLGIATGLVFTIQFVYVSEICPSSNRGFLNGIGMIIAHLGGTLSYGIGPYISLFNFDLLLLILSVIFVPVFFFIAPETPYYLSMRGRDTDALKTLKKLRSDSEATVEKELEDISTNSKTDESICENLKDRVVRKIFYTIMTLYCLQALSGMTVLMMYAEPFFRTSGSSISPEISALIVNLTQVLGGIITPLTCDKFGRKILLYISSLGCGVSMVILGSYFCLEEAKLITWLPLFCLVMTILFFSAGLAPVPNILIGELFPMSIKSIGANTSIAVSSVIGFLIAKYYDQIAYEIGMHVFMWIFGVVYFSIMIFAYFCIIETKGKSMHQIQQILRNEKNISDINI